MVLPSICRLTTSQEDKKSFKYVGYCIKLITYEIGPQKKVQNDEIYFQDHFRNFCGILRLCRTVYNTTYKKLEYSINRLPTRKKTQFLKFLQGQKIMDVFIVCIWTNSISIISGNVFQKPFNVIMQIIFFSLRMLWNFK